MQTPGIYGQFVSRSRTNCPLIPRTGWLALPRFGGTLLPFEGPMRIPMIPRRDSEAKPRSIPT